MCSPVINTSIKLASSWTAACPGASMPDASTAYAAVSGMWPCDSRGLHSLRDVHSLRDAHGVNVRERRFAQRIQDDQGRSVLGHLIEDTSVPAPATNPIGVTVKGGVSGPYPWRRPV